VELLRRSGGNADDVRQTFDVTSTPALASLGGGPMTGDWVLIVEDTAPQDTGTLNRWAVVLHPR
jgi:subtilisin-like proprotein convertase family protein